MNHLYTNPHLRVGFFVWRDVGKENIFFSGRRILMTHLNGTCVRKKICHLKLKKKKTRKMANSLKPARIYIRIK